MGGMERLEYSDLFIELPVLPHATGVVLHFNVLLLHIILSTTVSFLDLKGAILFLQVCFSFPLFFCKYTLNVCYVCNVS